MTPMLLPVTTDSEEARRRFHAGRVAAFHYQPNQAKTHLDAAIAADPFFVLAYLHRGGMSAPGERGPYFAKAREHRHRVSEDEGLLVDAFHGFLWDGRVEDAVAILSELSDRYPDDPYLPTYLGLRYLRNLGDAEEARTQFERAVTRDPTFSPAHHWLAQTVIELGDLDRAESLLHHYLELAPDQPRPYFALAELAMRRGNVEEAVRLMEQALDRDPLFADAREGLVRVALGRVVKDFEEASRGEPGSLADFFTRSGVIHTSAGEAHQGREEIAGYWQKVGNGGGVIRANLEEVYVSLEGDLATAIGQFHGARLGQFMSVWAHTAEGWRIHRLMLTTSEADA